MEVALQKFAESTKDDGTSVADVEGKNARVEMHLESALQQTRVFFRVDGRDGENRVRIRGKRHTWEPRTNRVTRESDASDLFSDSIQQR